MPEMTGIELTRAIRRISETPIIILSVREQETMKVAALDEGADDYVTKPFSMPELLARVRANLRKIAREEPAPPKSPPAISTSTRLPHRPRPRRRRPPHPKEFDLLLLFVNNPNRVLTHKFLLRQIWGSAGEDQPEYLRVLIAQLRKKLDPATAPATSNPSPGSATACAPHLQLLNDFPTDFSTSSTPSCVRRSSNVAQRLAPNRPLHRAHPAPRQADGHST
jgi:two-component system KDP operon response regulator KdpE